ncbi:MAG TPA: hypothetical protein VJ909_07190 [Prolixibacteraceae bacterium]|nr:hypothetical protein [Prolixibacteraceae bacterium]
MAIKVEDIELDHIQDFIANGKPESAPPEIVEFLHIMEKVRGMYYRFNEFNGRDAVVNHLVKVDGHSYYMSCKYYDMAMEYFFLDREISKKAHRNRLAEKMEKAINTAIAMAKDSREMIAAVKELKNVAQILQLDQPDKDEFPQELFDKPFKMYSVDADYLGIPKINRYELARIINEMPEISEKEREMIKREAGVLPVKLFLDPAEDARQSE